MLHIYRTQYNIIKLSLNIKICCITWQNIIKRINNITTKPWKGFSEFITSNQSDIFRDITRNNDEVSIMKLNKKIYFGNGVLSCNNVIKLQIIQ